MSAPRVGVPDMRPGRTWPDADTFAVLARDRRVVPVVRRLIADGETPMVPSTIEDPSVLDALTEVLRRR